jgi:hypothetical protein
MQQLLIKISNIQRHMQKLIELIKFLFFLYVKQHVITSLLLLLLLS